MTLNELKEKVDNALKSNPEAGDVQVVIYHHMAEMCASIQSATLTEKENDFGEQELCFFLDDNG